MAKYEIRYDEKGVIIETPTETRWIDAETWTHLVYEHLVDVIGGTPSELWKIIVNDYKMRDLKLPGKVIKRI